MKDIGMFEIVEMGRGDGDGAIGMEITNSACTLQHVYWHVPRHSSVFGQRSVGLLPKKDGCVIPHNFNTRN